MHLIKGYNNCSKLLSFAQTNVNELHGVITVDTKLAFSQCVLRVTQDYLY